MANGINDVYTGQLQGVTPEQLQVIARAKAAQGQLSGMNNSPAMVAALRDYKQKPLTMKGSGLASTAPTGLEALGSAVRQNRGQSRLNDMEQTAQALRGKITEGSIAEQRAELQRADFAQNAKVEQARLARENKNLDQLATEGRAATRADTVAEKKRTRVAFHDPSDPTKTLNLEQDGMGNWYRGGEIINPEFVENLTPYKAPDTGSVGYKQQKDTAAAANSLNTALDSLDYVDETLQSPSLKAATGTKLDLVKQYSDLTGLMPEAQYDATRMQNIAVQGIRPMLESGAFGKISDKDIELMLSTVTDASKEPLGLIKALEDSVLPDLKRRLRAQGQEELIPIVEKKISDIVKRGYKAQYPEMYQEIYGAESSEKVTSAQAKVDAIKARIAAGQQ